jgi:hypothetical protein
MKRAPWHSTRPGDGVYHDNDECVDGRFPALDRAEGTAGRPLCRECARLDTMAALEPQPEAFSGPAPERRP